MTQMQHNNFLIKTLQRDQNETVEDLQKEKDALIVALQEHERSWEIRQEAHKLLDQLSDRITQCEMAGASTMRSVYTECAKRLRQVLDGEKVDPF